MSAPVQVTKKVGVTPLVDIRDERFAQGYADGLRWWLPGEREGIGPVADSSLIENLESGIKHNLFDGHHEQELYRSLGFLLGMIHGGVLDRRGQLLAGMTTLVTLSDPDITRGYRCGRECYFLDLEPHELYMTDHFLVDRLYEDVQDGPPPLEDRKTWNFLSGNVLGELSGRLFPWTKEEHHAWEQECIRQIGYVCNLNPRCVAASLFAMQHV